MSTHFFTPVFPSLIMIDYDLVLASYLKYRPLESMPCMAIVCYLNYHPYRTRFDKVLSRNYEPLCANSKKGINRHG